jgi:hypothetical protein
MVHVAVPVEIQPMDGASPLMPAPAVVDQRTRVFLAELPEKPVPGSGSRVHHDAEPPD